MEGLLTFYIKLYLNVPFQISRKHKDSSGEEYIKHNWERKNVYGVGAGYDYNIPIYSHLSGFIGIGFKYTHFKNKVSGSANSTDKLPSDFQTKAYWESSVNKNAYSLLPSVGIRYSIGHWEAEVKYKLYLPACLFIGFI
ncbi:hypothetical protein [Parabacteroides chinchillae]|uniref:Uncharacterized protein n=1 Tax=Parabacteroides chinchillae TaxID=871327 RepID=A0A8G2F2A7_9BACT|nr:hypothetical protein [Parabacteroides chinchillae]SEF70965.1 hypothetical protein SAMN05444001_10573 [Parabacteroides chinchillae]